MANFSVGKSEPPRFEGDFLVVTNPANPPAGALAAYLNSLAATLDAFAAAEARDVVGSYPEELLGGRRGARKATAADLKVDAQKVSGGQLSAEDAAQRIVVVAAKNASQIPKFGTADRIPSRFDGDFKVVLVNDYEPGAADRLYLDNVDRALAEFADDEKKDRSENYSPGVIAFRKAQRKDTAGVLRTDVAGHDSGGVVADAADKVLMFRGRYQARRDRLTRRLFNVSLTKEPQDDGTSKTELSIHLLGGLPAPEDFPSMEKQDLFVQIHKALTVIDTVCARMHDRAETGWRRWLNKPDIAAQAHTRNLLNIFLGKLSGIATIGLENPWTPLAKAALAELRNEFFVQEAGRIKNKYVRYLGVWAAVFAAAFLGGYLAIEFKYPDWIWGHTHRSFLLAACGASIGAWASFSVRQVQFSFDDLVMMDENSLDPPLRIVFVVTLTLIACLLFWTGAINLEIGNLRTQPDFFKSSGSVAFLIGIFAGLSERALATAISGRAAAFVKGIGGAG